MIVDIIPQEVRDNLKELRKIAFDSLLLVRITSRLAEFSAGFDRYEI